MSDETVVYPHIEYLQRGMRIRTGKGSYLPGIYLNHIMAEKAIKRHIAMSNLARANKRTK